MRGAGRIRRVRIRIRRRIIHNDTVFFFIVALLLLLLNLLIEQGVFQRFVLLLQITNCLFLASLLRRLTLAGHFFGQRIDPSDFSVSIRIGWIKRGRRSDIQRLRARCILGFILTVMHPSAGISPFIDLLGLRDTAQRHGHC